MTIRLALIGFALLLGVGPATRHGGEAQRATRSAMRASSAANQARPRFSAGPRRSIVSQVRALRQLGALRHQSNRPVACVATRRIGRRPRKQHGGSPGRGILSGGFPHRQAGRAEASFREGPRIRPIDRGWGRTTSSRAPPGSGEPSLAGSKSSQLIHPTDHNHSHELPRPSTPAGVLRYSTESSWPSRSSRFATESFIGYETHLAREDFSVNTPGHTSWIDSRFALPSIARVR
jgi:hypothetical protein